MPLWSINHKNGKTQPSSPPRAVLAQKQNMWNWKFTILPQVEEALDLSGRKKFKNYVK